MPRTRALVCPVCGSRRVVPIVFGLPDDGVIAEVEEGRAVLGGRDAPVDRPEWRCRRCSHEWQGMTGARPRQRRPS